MAADLLSPQLVHEGSFIGVNIILPSSPTINILNNHKISYGLKVMIGVRTKHKKSVFVSTWNAI